LDVFGGGIFVGDRFQTFGAGFQETTLLSFTSTLPSLIWEAFADWIDFLDGGTDLLASRAPDRAVETAGDHSVRGPSGWP
jgi:hypothetical protein